MTPKEMESACLMAIDAGHRVTLSTPRGQRMPPGFPSGELLSVNQSMGLNNISYKPEKILRWLRENFLIEAVSDTAPSKVKERGRAAQ